MRSLLLVAVAYLSLAQSQNADYGDYQDYGGDYQDYQDGGYGQDDNLYADYAAKKAAGGDGGGWGKPLAFGVVGWFLGGKIHSKRAVSKANKKHLQEQKDLYKQYYQDVITLQTQNSELQQYVDYYAKMHQDGEFDAADIDHDNKVSRAEFNRYRSNYLQKHPEMASEFPRFEDFDPDSNGLISKAEYDAYYRALQA